MAGAVKDSVRTAADLYGAGRYADAAAECEAALAIAPGDPNLLNILALSKSGLGAHDDADDLLRDGIGRAPAGSILAASLYSSRGFVALRKGDRVAAETAMRAALAIDPNHADTNANLGCLLQDGDPAAAAACYKRALETNPDHLVALNNLGSLKLARGDVSGARDLYRRAVERAPDDPLSLRNLGKALRHGGDVTAALPFFEKAATLAPTDVDCQFGRALTLLMAGDYERGWEAYRWRYRLPDNPPRHTGLPEWTGGDPAGRTILVHTEQGFGDAIQFARFVPPLVARGAKVVLECPEPLTRLFGSLEGLKILLVRNRPPPPVDCQIPLLELARILGARPDNLPAPPYLSARHATVQHVLMSRPGRFKIGLVPGTRSKMSGSGRKSLPPPLGASLLGIPAVDFYLMQPDAAPADRVPYLDAGAVDLAPRMPDFAASAALVEQLDLVVTVDTAMAHLAGALGKPVWVLLHAYPDWRWMASRADSPWYPSARLYRQRSPGDWTGVVDAVRSDLVARLQ